LSGDFLPKRVRRYEESFSPIKGRIPASVRELRCDSLSAEMRGKKKKGEEEGEDVWK
jgi:hypothetical protein